MSNEVELFKEISGDTFVLSQLSWSPDGRILAVGVKDGTIRLWNIQTAELIVRLERHPTGVSNIVWSPNGRTLASCIGSYVIRLWDVETGNCQQLQGEISSIKSMAWSPDGGTLAVAGSKGKLIQLWNVKEGKIIDNISLSDVVVYSLMRLPNEKEFVVISSNSICRLNIDDYSLRRVALENFNPVNLKLSPDGKILASGVSYGIKLWDTESGQDIGVLESSHQDITSISFSHDGEFLSSISFNGTVEIWACEGWKKLSTIQASQNKYHTEGTVAFSPTESFLATVHNNGTELGIWRLDVHQLLGRAAKIQTALYTTVKVALVGRSGVGKTVLGWRLVYGAFKEHPSSHGQHFWLFDAVCCPQVDGTHRDVILWDLAGQQDYHITHALFLGDVDLALILFDSSDQTDPFKDVEYWLKQLDSSEGACRKILVGSKSDRGYPSISKEELVEFCRDKEISGGYVITSAFTGDSLPDLVARIKSEIELIEAKATIATTTFNQIKSLVLGLKEQVTYQHEGTGTSKVVVTALELRQWLAVSDPSLNFSHDEMLAAINHLARHGFVTKIHRSAGDEVILLIPELLNNLAASFVLEARRNEKGLGAIDEASVLKGEYPFPELTRLSDDERNILLDATTTILIERNICFRAILGKTVLLIFPALINQKRPITENKNIFESTTFIVKGAVENIYSTLVVLLGYTNTFIRTNQWQNQAQYEIEPREVCGFRMMEEHEGELQFVLYFDKAVPQHVQLLFEGLFEKFLRRPRVEVNKFPSIKCGKCKNRLPRALVVKFMSEGKEHVHCPECGHIVLFETKPILTKQEAGLYQKVEKDLKNEAQQTELRTTFETAMVRVKRYVQDAQRSAINKPTCFLSYAWGDSAHERWVTRLAEDLKHAEINILLDKWHNAEAGSNIARYIEKIEMCDFVLVVGTPLYKKKHLGISTSVVSKEVDIINALLMEGKESERHKFLPLLRAGGPGESFPALLRGLVYIDFKSEKMYFASLFDLILNLYRVSTSDANFADLRAILRAGDVEVFEADRIVTAIN